MAHALRILLLAHSDRDGTWLRDTLVRAGYTPVIAAAADEAAARAATQNETWDAVVCMFQGASAPAALRAFRARNELPDPPLILLGDAFSDLSEAALRLGAAMCLRDQGIVHLQPAIERVLRERAERAQRHAAIRFEQGQRAILEQIADGRRLADVLEDIVLLIEHQGDGMLCSILLLEGETGRVRHGAAPHLPRALVEGVDGAPIGPKEGSCGAAAYLREPVIIDDIGTHPNWTNYRHLVLPDGLRACWSSPIFAAPDGAVLGTFAMYYREARVPTAAERVWVDRATHLAAIAIAREHAERSARDANMRYRQIVETAYEGVWLIDADARTLFVNQRSAKLLGYDSSELLGRRIVEFMDEPSRAVAEGTFLERLRTVSEQQEFRFRRKDGSSFWALVSGCPIRDDHGELVGALGMITDITELKRTEEALRKSEAEFRVVFENAAIGMALVNSESKIVRSNRALQHFLGYEADELRGRAFAELAHPDDRDPDRDIYSSLMKQDRDSYRSEKRYQHRDGSVVWGRLAASVVQPADGMPPSVIVMIENVTDRRQLEEAVRASERLRGLMYGAVSDVLFYLSAEPSGDFRFLSVNPAFLRATGLPESDVIGRSVSEVIPRPSLSQVLENYQRAIRERRTVTWDEITPYPKGKKYGEVSVTPIFDAIGTCTNLVGTVHDVTQRRMAEERVAAQAALLDQAKDAIIVRGLDGEVRYWNKGAERIYGWSSAEALGKNVLELIYANRDQFAVAQRRLEVTGAWSGELTHRTKRGRPIAIEGSWTLIPAQQTQEAAVFAINSDITERKRLEAEIAHAQRLESLGILAGGLAHDFNNLLTAIIGNVEVANLDLASDHPACTALAEIAQASARGSDLMRQLLTFSRKSEPSRKFCALAPIVSEALGLLRAVIPKSIAIHTDFTCVANVLADTTQIHQIVMNLGTNAAHAIGKRSGRIEVRLDEVKLDAPLSERSAYLAAGSYVRLSFSDSGNGMDEPTLDRIFEPFFTTKAEGIGTGLGLSVVHGIVRSHEGAVIVHSRPGDGTQFLLYFPAGMQAAVETGDRAVV